MSAILVEDLAVFAGETRLLGPLSFKSTRGGAWSSWARPGPAKASSPKRFSAPCRAVCAPPARS